ncbi:MAG: acyl-CoA dehydrogenase family protein [Sphingorhabdus sp.]
MNVSNRILSAKCDKLDQAALDNVEHAIAVDAETVDIAGTFPQDAIGLMAEVGLLEWPFWETGRGIGPLDEPLALSALLTRIGRASLTVGRLFEGHVNGAILIKTYGNYRQNRIVATEAANGRMTGVWNAERGAGLIARRDRGGWRIDGMKIFCSGAGSIRRPVVTVRTADTSDILMMLPDMASSETEIDLSAWRPTGMKGTATATVRFHGLFVPDDAVVGGPGDYYRSPLFSGGAWRVLAVQLGGLQRIVALHAERLIAWSREDDALMRARFASAGQSLELARLLVAETASRAHGGIDDPAGIDAYVDAARGNFESLAFSIVENTRRNIGLSSFIAPDPLDRIIRDLETYLRQPFLDASRDNAARWLLQHRGSFAP